MAPRKKLPPLPAHLVQWCTLRSIPKKQFKPAAISRGKKGKLKDVLPRLIELAVPGPRRLLSEACPDKLFFVSPNALKYKVTPRVLILATPLLRKKYVFEDSSIYFNNIDKKTLKYKATPRIKKLCNPLDRKRYKYIDVMKYYQVKRKALKGKSSPRVEELSKELERKHTKKYKEKKWSTGVKKSTLSAVASPRVEVLAHPKDRKDTVTRTNFKISKQTLTYEPTERITKLAKNIPRRMTPKFIAQD